MGMQIKFCVLDSDSGRRARICWDLTSNGCHAEPFDCISEMRFATLKPSAFLVHDNGENLAFVLNNIEQMSTWAPVFAYQQLPEARSVVDAIRLGAEDYLRYPFNTEHLISSTSQLLNPSNPTRMANIRRIEARRRIKILSRRELQVLSRVARGRSSKEIGKVLGISYRTVETHRANMMAKLDAANTLYAAQIAIDAGLAEIDADRPS